MFTQAAHQGSQIKTVPQVYRVEAFQPRSLFHRARSLGTQRPGPGMVQQSITKDHEVHLVTKHNKDFIHYRNLKLVLYL